MNGIGSAVTGAIMISPASVVNFAVAGSAALIGVFVFFRRKSNMAAGLFLLVCLNIAFWVICSTMADVVRDVGSAEFWLRMAIVGPFLFMGFFLMLSFEFPVRLRKLSLIDALTILVPSLIAISLSATQLNIRSVRLTEWGADFTPGPMYAALIVYVLAYLLLIVRNYVRAWRRSEERQVRIQIALVCAAIASMLSVCIVANFVLPIFGETRFSVFGPAGAILFVLLLAHAIVRHKLLDLRVVAAEVFALVIVVINFVEMLLADSVERFVLRTLLFLVSAAAGLMLIRSVIVEVRRRQQLQHLATKLEDMNMELKHLDEMKSEFISIASHQLRTPVSVIKGYLSLIKDGAFGEIKDELKEKLEQIYDMNERLVHLINNLLNMSRIEKGSTQFWCSEVNVAEIVRRVVNEMHFKISGRELKMEFIEPKDDIPNVFVDPERLTEVVTNLVDNAIKYTHSGSITVSIEGDGPESPVTVWVKDTGVGIDAEDMKHVFQKFYRPHRPSDEHKAGLSLGLGLYICAKFLRSMGGDIWVERTAPGKGTTIGFSLPVRPSGTCDVQDDGQEQENDVTGQSA